MGRGLSSDPHPDLTPRQVISSASVCLQQWLTAFLALRPLLSSPFLKTNPSFAPSLHGCRLKFITTHFTFGSLLCCFAVSLKGWTGGQVWYFFFYWLGRRAFKTKKNISKWKHANEEKKIKNIFFSQNNKITSTVWHNQNNKKKKTYLFCTVAMGIFP